MTAATIPSSIRRSSAWIWLFAVWLSVGLHGCADRPDLPVPNFASATPNPIQISRTQTAHIVSFPSGGSEPEAAQLSALFAFIAADSVGPKDTVLIEHGGELIDQAHAETVSSHLAAIGLHPVVVNAANLASGLARVVVERYVAISPHCPDWSHKPSPNFQNYDQRNFGCADAVNLAAMVADPKDLALGTTPGPQVGDPVTRPIYDYRAGEPGNSYVGFVFGVGATSKDAPASAPRGSSSSGGGAAAGSSAAPSATGP